MLLHSWHRRTSRKKAVGRRRPRPAAYRPALESLEARTLLNGGGLDLGGRLTLDFPGSARDAAAATALQPDGKIVVVGLAHLELAPPPGRPDYPVTQTNGDVGLARFTPDGRLDPTFGTGGLVTTDLGTGEDHARGVIVQPDGKLLVLTLTLLPFVDNAHVTNGTDGDGPLVPSQDVVLLRYNADGSPDATFGTGG